jgi:beta-lactam-binding protein with PASTA domain
MLRYSAAALAAVLLLVGTACGSTRPRPVPDVTGKRLDVAEDTLDALGLRYRTAGGGAFGIIVRSHWYVCEQTPSPKAVATTVALTVARSCAVPDVVGESLEDAEDELRDAGIAVNAHSLDGDPIIVESFWTVCEQSPEGGAPTGPVELYVSHDDCCEYES